ncbi:MAG TPA: hypothetical protein VG496_14275 [Myxococcales bacterium]|nr:hypothetical protein [Myxococcales bacterium]
MLAFAVGCADWQRPPLTAPYRAGGPLIQEQAMAGVAKGGSAAAVQLVDAEGAAPRLELLVLDASGGATRRLAVAPEQAAAAVARRIRADGHQAAPLLGAIAREEWPDAFERAAREGFLPLEAANPDRGAREWSVASTVAAEASRSLVVRVALAQGDPPAFMLLLAQGGAEVELARQPISGTPIEGGLWKAADALWLLSGSVAEDDPLRRAVGLRHGSIRRGESLLHNARGLALRAGRDLAGAAREFEYAVEADPRYVDALYNSATTAALSGRELEAVAWLHRAAEVDRRRVQVLGRDDESLHAVRDWPEVREILGMKRAPPQTSK